MFVCLFFFWFISFFLFFYSFLSFCFSYNCWTFGNNNNSSFISFQISFIWIRILRSCSFVLFTFMFVFIHSCLFSFIHVCFHLFFYMRSSKSIHMHPIQQIEIFNQQNIIKTFSTEPRVFMFVYLFVYSFMFVCLFFLVLFCLFVYSCFMFFLHHANRMAHHWSKMKFLSP